MSRVFLGRELDTVATFWRIYRTDGVAHAFTTHDCDLWFGGLAHLSAPAMLPSAIRKTAGLDDDGAEIEGALSHDTITERDLEAGRFRGASICVGAVDWRTLEAKVLYRGAIENVFRDGQSFSARLRSSKAILDVDPIPRSSPTCRARFCDRDCTLSASKFTSRATVTHIDFDRNALSVDIADLMPFAFGELKPIDGPQCGQTFNVASVSSGDLALGRPIDRKFAAGMRVWLRQGCDRTIATCAGRFGNAANFRGEPYLPGNDLLAQYPMPR